MAELKITINEKKFAEVSGGKFDSFTPTRIVGMDWIIQVNEKGFVEAFYKEKAEEGEYSVKVKLMPGTIMETRQLTTSDGVRHKKGKKESKIPTISGINGVLVLSDGNFEERHGYYMSRDLVYFKKSFSIEKIESCNPNQLFEVPLNTVFYTDGKYSKQIIDYKNCLLEVKEATWILIESPENLSGKKTRVLYTLKPYNKLKLPKVLSSRGRSEIVNSFKKEFASVEDALKYVDTLNLFKKDVYELEEYISDEVRIKAIYYLDADGILKVYVSRTAIWNSRESLEASLVNTDLVVEEKDTFTKIDRIFEGCGYVKAE